MTSSLFLLCLQSDFQEQIPLCFYLCTLSQLEFSSSSLLRLGCHVFLANSLVKVSYDKGHKSTSITPPLSTDRLLESLRVTSLTVLMTVFDKAYCEDTANAGKAGLCSDKVSVCLDVCLTCDPGAMLAAYGSNWAARKLTKCQWSVVPQEVINCGPRGQ